MRFHHLKRDSISCQQTRFATKTNCHPERSRGTRSCFFGDGLGEGSAFLSETDLCPIHVGSFTVDMSGRP
jgi:hypothetical protein